MKMISLILVSLLQWICLTAGATEVVPKSTSELIKEAQLIFVGEVTKVEYRISTKKAPGDLAAPHVFVTFLIEQILKGKIQGQEYVTLRFTGGPTTSGTILTVPGIPLFDVGDRDLLFVTGNTDRICPLVGWYQGRFRILEEQIYSDGGREVWLKNQQELVLGSWHALKEVTMNRVGDLEIHRSYSSLEDQKVDQMESKKGVRMEIANLIRFVQTQVNRLQTKQELSQLPVLTSASAASQFFFRLPEAQFPADNQRQGK